MPMSLFETRKELLFNKLLTDIYLLALASAQKARFALNERGGMKFTIT